MKKNIYLISISLAIMLIINALIIMAAPAIEFGNKICPVSNERLIAGEVIKYEYRGVVYNVCCKMCLKDFKKNPEKYIKKLKAQKEEAEKGSRHGEHYH
ncbi:MAG: TRASH domain-containing protein [Omnitrophica bacterium]|nr:TRASH domain-containing protein [Candidatus Omnitrophota bacterium]